MGAMNSSGFIMLEGAALVTVTRMGERPEESGPEANHGTAEINLASIPLILKCSHSRTFPFDAIVVFRLPIDLCHFCVPDLPRYRSLPCLTP